MKTSEIVYMALDLAKAATSDDSFFTEAHVLFLCKKYRAFLIKKEQEKNRGTEDSVSVFEMQQVCLDLEKVPAIDGESCTGGYYLRSTQPIPKLLEGHTPKVYPIDYYQGTNITFVSSDRMRYTGTNKYLRNILYASIGPDFHLYVNSSNPQFFYLKKLRMQAAFEDFEDVAKMLCDQEGSSTSCGPLEAEFPIREYLVPALLELVVKELTTGKYQATDEQNNAKDDMGAVRTPA